MSGTRERCEAHAKAVKKGLEKSGTEATVVYKRPREKRWQTPGQNCLDRYYGAFEAASYGVAGANTVDLGKIHYCDQPSLFFRVKPSKEVQKKCEDNVFQTYEQCINGIGSKP